MAKLSAASTVSLKHSGCQMPIVALGLWQSTNGTQSCQWAFESGYRHIDSARCYRNESEVGEALRNSKLKREDVFLTTKIQGREQSTIKCRNAIKTSTERLGTSAPWDLILLHDPTGGKLKRLEGWRELQSAKQHGFVKAIGVSNFGVKHLEEFETEGGGGIDVNQIELHPWCQQKDIVDYCEKKGIVLQAYCPLVRGAKFKDPTLTAIAAKQQKTPAQILLRWSLQRGFVPLPKSDNLDRIKQNIDVFDFELNSEAMDQLNALNEGAKGACSWNPVNHA